MADEKRAPNSLPEATKRLGDATLSPKDRDATGEALARAGERRETSLPTREADEAASHLGQEDADETGGGQGKPQGSPSTKPAPRPSDRLPSAGPHADPALTNPDATPGTGTLQPPGGNDDVESTSG